MHLGNIISCILTIFVFGFVAYLMMSQFGIPVPLVTKSEYDITSNFTVLDKFHEDNQTYVRILDTKYNVLDSVYTQIQVNKQYSGVFRHTDISIGNQWSNSTILVNAIEI